MSSLFISRVRHLALAAITSLLLLHAPGASAQWSIRSYVGPSIHFVKMMDEVGQNDIGYIGREQGGLLRTTDAGFNWTPVTFNGGINDELYDIAFKNPVIGFAVGEAGTYRSVDSGKTWSQISTTKGRAIAYIPSSNMVLMTSWVNLAQASTDDGQTWYSCSSSEMNGITYLDDSHFMFTPHAGQAKFTSDGGASWETCNMSVEVYQPAAMPFHGWYIGVSEHDHSVWRSTDGGFNWDNINFIFNPTGCVRGSDQNLIAQTKSGMVRSTDQGSTWQDLCGPDNTYDTRFWVHGLKIFAVSSSGYFYYNPTSSAAMANFKIEIGPDPLRLTTDGCTKPTGEIKISTDACSVQLTQASLVGSSEFTFVGLSLPADLKSSTTVTVLYTPVGSNVDSATVLLRLDVGGLIIDTFVKVYGTTAPMISPSISPNEVKLTMSPLDCKIDEEKVAINNLGCDDFTIDSFQLSDPIHFTISGLNPGDIVPGQGALAFTVLSSAVNIKKAVGVVLIYVSNPAGARILRLQLELNRLGPVLRPMADKRHVFNTTCDPLNGAIDFTNLTCDTIFVDSVTVSNTAYYKILPLSLPRALVKDQSISIPYEVKAPRPGPSSSRLQVYYRTAGLATQQIAYLFASTNVQVVLPADTVKFTASGSCPEFDSTFGITNILCDPIRILELKPLFQPQFTLTLPTLPVTLATHDVASIGVSTNTFFKGVSRTSILMRYEAYGKIYDTIVHIAVRNTTSFSVDPKLSKVNFGRTSVCAPQTRTIYIGNRYCIPVTIDRLRLSAATSNRFTILSQPAPQRVLAPGDRDSVVLQFAPDALGSRVGAVELRLKSAVITLDTFFTIEGIGTGTVNANIRDTRLALGEALHCQHLEQTTVVRNDGCVDLSVTSISPNGGPFNLVSPSLPQKIAPGDSVTLTFALATTQPGLYDQKVIVRLVSAQNVEQLLDCELNATLTAEAPHLLVPPLALGQLNGCQPFDTTITVTNPLICDPIDVTAEFTSPDASIVGPATAVIPPGESYVFRLLIQPNTANSMKLRLLAASIDTTIELTYAFVGGGGELTLSGPANVLKTNACDAVIDTVFIATGDCHGEMIEELRLTPVGGTATRFSLVNTYNFPLNVSAGQQLPIPIRFDPRAAGVNSATLDVLANGPAKSFALNGEFVPVGSVSASITSAGAKAVIVGDEFDVDLEVTINGAAPMTIEDLIAALSYDSDLLTLIGITPKGQWTLKDKDTEQDEAELTFAHPKATFSGTEPLATLHFRTSIAREKSSSVKLEGLLVNGNDPRFNECIATTSFDPSSNDVSVTYFCGGETLRGALNGKLPFSNIVVQPHPVSTAARNMKVSFDLATDAEVSIEMINVLGVTTTTSHVHAIAGHNEIQLPLSDESSGWHLLRLKTELGSAGIRVLLTD